MTALRSNRITPALVREAWGKLNAQQVVMLLTVSQHAPGYRDRVVSYYRLDKRITNALVRHELVTEHTHPVEGVKLTALGRRVVAVATTPQSRRR